MDQDFPGSTSEFPNPSETRFGKNENSSEVFGNLRKGDSETFGTIPKLSEKTEHHTLTVREVAKLFDDSSVPRTERSIINWCNLNKQGISRLDCYFDPNDRKYFITPQSVHRVITEEVNKTRSDKYYPQGVSEDRKNISETFGSFPKESPEDFRSVPNDSESHFGNLPKQDINPKEHRQEKSHHESEEREKDKKIQELEAEVFDLKITNKGKDFFIKQLQEDRESFGKEREHLINQLVAKTEQIGVLKTKLLQLGAPEQNSEAHRLDEKENSGDGFLRESEQIQNVGESDYHQNDQR